MIKAARPMVGIRGRRSGAAAATLLLLSMAAAAPRAEQVAMAGSAEKPEAATQHIPQHGAPAAAVRAQLARIQLPPGFAIELFALAPSARHMAVAADGTVWIGTRDTMVWRARDRDGDHVADRVRSLTPQQVAFDMPNGVCLDRDGALFVVERNRVLRFPEPGAGAAPITVVARGDLIPPPEESWNHSARVCVIGPDGMLYISLGQPYNVSPPHKQAEYSRSGIGGIIRMQPDGSGREVIATGIRNSVGHAFNPADGSLWFTDNQVDGMGDETPPGELNRMPRAGMWYGFPYYGGGEVRTRAYANRTLPPELAARYVSPQVEMRAHAADLGMMFYGGAMFPPEYYGAIFSAQHGSWDASVPRGARVMVTFVDANGNAAETRPFAEGWLLPNGRYAGRPVDVQQYVDGSLLVSDDKAGAVYRIYYRGE